MLHRTITLVCLLGLGTTIWADKDPEPPADTPKVRKLTVNKTPSEQGFKSKVTVCKTQADLEKVAGKDVAKELAKQVKFATEQVVLVNYRTGGPPYGLLKYEIKGKGKKIVEFYILEPKVNKRGQALRVRLEFFAVSKGAEVKFGPAR